jgi:hypothetical protein
MIREKWQLRYFGVNVLLMFKTAHCVFRNGSLRPIPALRVHRYVAGIATEIRPISGIHDLKAIGGALNGWRIGPFVLAQAGHASLATDRTP